MTTSTDQIYCVKCKAKTDNVNAERVTMKNGRPGHQGAVRHVRHQQVPDRRIAEEQ